MEIKALGRSFLPLLALFALSSILIVAGEVKLAAWNIDPKVLLAGNGVLFLATAISFLLYTKALRNPNVQFFLRMLYSSLLVKMFLCLAATFIYVMLAGRGVNKLAVITCFVLYVIYTFVEVKIIMRLSKFQKNA
jgi:hypothetical protein